MAIKTRKLVCPVSGDQASLFPSQTHSSHPLSFFPLPTDTMSFTPPVLQPFAGLSPLIHSPGSGCIPTLSIHLMLELW